MRISEIMSQPAVTVELDDALGDVKEIFEQTRIRHVLVCDEGKLFGVLSERDLLRTISPFASTDFYNHRDLATLSRPVHHIVTRKPRYLPHDAEVRAAIEMFQGHHIGCIPVVDDDGVPVGIVTRGDVIRHFDAICVAAHPSA